MFSFYTLETNLLPENHILKIWNFIHPSWPPPLRAAKIILIIFFFIFFVSLSQLSIQRTIEKQ